MTTCLHCDRRTSCDCVLCNRCRAVKGIALLYKLSLRDNPILWERHLKLLTWRASRRLPLFETRYNKDAL